MGRLKPTPFLDEAQWTQPASARERENGFLTTGFGIKPWVRGKYSLILALTPGRRVPPAEVKSPGLGPVEVMEVTPIYYGGSLTAA